MPTFVDQILGAIATNTSAFVVDFVTTYWAYILGVSVIVGIGSMFLRLGHFGHYRR